MTPLSKVTNDRSFSNRAVTNENNFERLRHTKDYKKKWGLRIELLDLDSDKLWKMPGGRIPLVLEILSGHNMVSSFIVLTPWESYSYLAKKRNFQVNSL